MAVTNRITSITLNAANLSYIELICPTGSESALEELILTGIEEGEYLPYKTNTIPYLNCSGNKLKFNSMPKIIVEDANGGNYYFCANQQDSVNTEGNYIGEPIDLHTDYFFKDVKGIMWDANTHDFGVTQYTWKDQQENILQQGSDYTTDGNGYFTFTNPNLAGKAVTCEMTHNLFSINTQYEQFPGMYASGGNTEGQYNNLILKYQTFLYKDPTVGIKEQEQENIRAYFSGETLVIEKEADMTARIAVCDMAGKQLYEATAGNVNQVAVHTQGWGSGMYFISITSGETSVVRKIRKQ
ncbi:MAG: T9SS type A sorting domain-containing protein [Candidatus Azobacteroides sp.]|nr:T9SS type A sorting domain-containing protein [Candidatus Azobacteroides sp.]